MISIPSSVYSINLSSVVRTELKRIPHQGIDYGDIERITSVASMDAAGAKMKLITHKDIPSGEVHLVDRGQCVGKIINL